MKKDDLLKIEGVTEAIADAILDQYKGYVPKSRFDEVNEAKKHSIKLVEERDAQIAKLKESEGASEELKKQIALLQADNQKAQEDLKRVKLDNAVANALREAGAWDAKAVMPYLTVTELEEDGTVKGLADQLKALKESENHSFLFKMEKKSEPVNPVGATPSKGGKQTGMTKEEFNKMSYKARVELFNNDRELYDQMTKESE